MATLFSADVQVTAAPIAIVTTTETLLVVGAALTLPSNNAKACVRGWLDLTIGAGVTAVAIAIYQGSVIGGRLVGAKTPLTGDFVDGGTAFLEYEVVDNIANAGSAQYCMSVTQTGATGNGNVTAALLETTLLSG